MQTEDDRPQRTADVSRYLARAGAPHVRLVKGPGWFCFEGPPTDDWIDHTVHVPFLTDLTFGEWLETFRVMDRNPANRLKVRAVPRP